MPSNPPFNDDWNEPHTPPDAVSGAATPEPCYGEAGFCYIHKRLVRFCRKEGLEIRKPFDKLHDPPAEPTATPAQQCKCAAPYQGCHPVGTPNRCERCGGLIAEPAATPEAQIPEKWQRLYREVCFLNPRFPGAENPVQFVIEELAAAHAQLAALRVERDQAWNEALDMAIDCGEEIGMTERMREMVRSLARPIPTGPGEAKK